MIRDRKEWTSQIRSLLQRPGAPIQQSNGRWSLIDRRKAWVENGSAIFDDHLDRFKKIALQVLGEPDPQFELEPGKRFAANIHGKSLRHSQQLRQGIAETIALLGSFPEELVQASKHRPEETALTVVRGLLEDANWVRWASLSQLLPMLAEGAPDEFLRIVEKALTETPPPFVEVFAQERGDVFGRNYMTGLLWALESLAWSEAYLSRVVVILANLAALDRGGQWANRPKKSLAEILLPWLPHTAATSEKRINAIKAVIKKQPTVGWDLLVDLLPNSHRTSSGTHKPKWQAFVPENAEKGVSSREFWEQSSVIGQLAVENAIGEFGRLLELLKRIEDLPPAPWKSLLGHLENASANFNPEQRQELWDVMLRTISKHRKFAHADWVMAPDRLADCERIAELFRPSSPSLLNRRLFTQNSYELYDESTDIDEQENRLNEKRIKAVEEIYRSGKLNAVLEFAKSVEAPFQVGWALGNLPDATEAESNILPGMLSDGAGWETRFADGYIWSRFHRESWKWIESSRVAAWNETQIGQFLAKIPFVKEAWEYAAKHLPESGKSYWSRTYGNPYSADSGLDYAIDRFIEHGRPDAAIHAVYSLVARKRPFEAKQAVAALTALLKEQDLLQNNVRSHEVVEIIKALQSDRAISENDLFQVEWGYLKLLDRFSGASPRTLEKRLAEDPAFFCEIIQLLYRSKSKPKGAKSAEEPSPEKKRLAENAWHLLFHWRRPPGANDDGPFNSEALAKWYSAVEELSTKSGHREVALSHVGHVLRYAPADPEGLWIHRAAAELLDGSTAAAMRDGYSAEWFNSRGAYTGTGGQEELRLAAAFKEKAEKAEAAGYINLATTLRNLARSYEYDAERQRGSSSSD